ncbi:MAG: hypothetical protein AB7Q00_07670 [Phycisphaerales bacterium]
MLPLLSSRYKRAAVVICRSLLIETMRRARVRLFASAGKSRPIKSAIIAMTTSNSISVNPS